MTKRRVTTFLAAAAFVLAGLIGLQGQDGINMIALFFYVAIAALLVAKEFIPFVQDWMVAAAIAMLGVFIFISLLPMGHSLNICGYRSWWTDQFGPIYVDGTEQHVWRGLADFGIGSMNWLDINFLRELIGILAMGLVALRLILKEQLSQWDKIIEIALMVMLIVSSQLVSIIGFYLVFHLIKQEE